MDFLTDNMRRITISYIVVSSVCLVAVVACLVEVLLAFAAI